MRFTYLSSAKIACLALFPVVSLAEDFGIELSMSMATEIDEESSLAPTPYDTSMPDPTWKTLSPTMSMAIEIDEEPFSSPAPTPYDTSMPDAVWKTLSPTHSSLSPTAYAEDAVQSTSSTESSGTYCGDGEVGNGICATDGYCCSAYGYCGEGDAYW